MIQGTSSYETNSGHYHNRNSPTLKFQQDKVFTERLQYNGVQELQEFEVAPFIDQAIH
jgi:hypothetical protein